LKPWKYSVDLNLNEIRTLGVSHIIIKVPIKTSYRIDYNEEVNNEDNQIIQVDAYLQSTRHKQISNMKPWSSDSGNLRYHILLDGITDVVSMDLKNLKCTNNAHPRYLLVELLEPWASGSGQFYFLLEK
jgi:hypothetical protein